MIVALVFFVVGILCQISEAKPLDALFKVDCHPDPNASQQNCQARGCIWQTVSPPTGEPFCYFDPTSFAGYDLTQVLSNTSSSITATLQRRNTPTILGNDVNTLKLTVNFINDNYLQITLVPSSGALQKTLLSEQIDDRITSIMNQIQTASNPLYTVQIQNTQFGIKVIRKSTNQAIFDTTGIPGLTFENQFISMTTRTASANVYGFGEQVHTGLRQNMNWHKWGMFARDEPSGGSIMNLYGVHPFYLCMEDGGNAHAVFLYNTHAQNVELAPYPSVTYRAIGGNLVFHIFLGPTPENVLQQYHRIIGLPHMPPYWSLGFHLCRFGHSSSTASVSVLVYLCDSSTQRHFLLFLDTQWIDIDYTYAKMDFTYNTSSFDTLPQFAQTLHSSQMKLVLITDPAIASNPPISYAPLNDGKNQNVFIVDARTNQPLEGKVWPGNTYFPDFTHPNTTGWWTAEIKNFHDVVSFDGLWIDMNEPSNFVTGSLTGCSNNQWNNPPFVPLNDTNILTKTICMDAIQHAGKHYDLHSLYGYYESIATKSALETIFSNQKTFVLSRSTFAGSGVYAAHWTGDNTSDWPDMLWSIITLIEFNFFGIPFVGADICGFNNPSNEELCTRWMQLGAFYPFSRNHNSNNEPDQDPAVWSSNSIQSSKNALLVRYTLLPHLYTLLQQAHSNGSSVMRPLFFEFTSDLETYGISDQFLWGSGFMVVPVITQGSTSRTAYFPASRWFNYSNGAEIENPSIARTVLLQIGLYDLPSLYVRGGTIIPWQNASQTTVQSRTNPMGLLVALDSNQVAIGALYWDDGITLDADKKGLYSFFTFNATYKGSQYGILTIQRTHSGYTDIVTMDTIKVYGLISKPTSVTVNGASVSSSQINYDSTNNAMTLSSLKLAMFSSTNVFQIQWNYF